MAEETSTAEKPSRISAHERLEETAKALFIDKTRRGLLPVEMEPTAHRCFQLATAFHSVSAKVKSGELSAAVPIEPRAELIEVAQFDLTGENTWTPRIDEKTQMPVIFEELADPYAFARNLPVEHPINQRFTGGKLIRDPKTGKTELAGAVAHRN